MADNRLSETIKKVSYSSYHKLPSKGIFLYIKAVKDDKTVVLKALKEELRDRILFCNVLKKEFEISKNLSHPNVVRYNDIVETDEYGLCIEQEYVDGITLKSYLLEGHIDDDKIAIVNQIASALEYIHGQGVIHRNLNTYNVLISTHDNVAKITDFSVLSVDALKPGSEAMRFIAPELKDETIAADALVDIYSLGVVIKSMGLTLAYSEHIKRCCAFKRSERYADVGEFLADFNKSGSSMSMPKISGGMVKVFGLVIILICIVIAVLCFKDTLSVEFGKINLSSLFSRDKVEASVDTLQVDKKPKIEARRDSFPTTGKMAFLKTMKPALYKDLDGIFSKFDNKAMTVANKTKLNARIKAYYKGLIAANDTLDNEQRLALDNIFGNYVKAKKAALR